MSFLDSEEKINQTFGDHPAMLSERPWDSNNMATSKLLQYYAELCKLDIFMHLCKLDYVGEDNVESVLNVVEVCCHISKLKKVWSSRSTVYTNTPDELYDKFTRLSVSLLNDAKKWSIQLCSTYLAALSPELVEEVTGDKNFKMPDLTTLTTKPLQVKALRTVRRHGSSGWKEILKQKKKNGSYVPWYE